MCMCMCVCACVYVFVCMCLCVCACVYVHVCKCVYVFMHVCMVCLGAHSYTQPCTHVWAHVLVLGVQQTRHGGTLCLSPSTIGSLQSGRGSQWAQPLASRMALASASRSVGAVTKERTPLQRKHWVRVAVMVLREQLNCVVVAITVTGGGGTVVDCASAAELGVGGATSVGAVGAAEVVDAAGGGGSVELPDGCSVVVMQSHVFRVCVTVLNMVTSSVISAQAVSSTKSTVHSRFIIRYEP